MSTNQYLDSVSGVSGAACPACLGGKISATCIEVPIANPAGNVNVNFVVRARGHREPVGQWEGLRGREGE